MNYKNSKFPSIPSLIIIALKALGRREYNSTKYQLAYLLVMVVCICNCKFCGTLQLQSTKPELVKLGSSQIGSQQSFNLRVRALTITKTSDWKFRVFSKTFQKLCLNYLF